MARAQSVLRLGLLGVAVLIVSLAAADDPLNRSRLTEELRPQWDEAAPSDTPIHTDILGGDPREMVGGLTLRERVSQLMFVPLQGAPSPDSEDARLLRNYPPGGVIVPAVMRPTTAAAYVETLRRAPLEAQRGIPLFIATNVFDLPRRDGGLRAYFRDFPTLLTLAAANDLQATEQLADMAAEYIDTLGFNTHLGPSLELAPTLRGAQGSVHCLGSDPVFASMAGRTIIEGIQKRNIVAVPMGFPGGGANRTTRQPAVLMTPEPSLATQDLMAYARAIQAGARMVHVGNTLTPTIDPVNRPASLSEPVITGLLREKMGFDGVVLAGPMDTADIGRLHDPSRAVRYALEAGADMILWRDGGNRIMRAVDHITHAVEQGEMDEAVINRAVRRVLRLKDEQGLRRRELPRESAARRLERRTDAAETYELQRRAITVVQNRGNVLPLSDEASAPIGVTGVTAVEDLYEAMQDHVKHVVQQPITTARHAGAIHDFEIRRLTRRAPLKTAICIFTGNERADGQRELIQALQARGTRVVVVLLGYPDRLTELTGADAIVLAYAMPEVAGPAMKAVAEALTGAGPIRITADGQELRTEAGKAETFSVFDIVQAPAGRLPVRIGDSFPAGHAVAYDPRKAIRRAEWRFGEGRTIRGLEVEHTFRQAGRYPVTITITGANRDRHTGTFYVLAEEPGAQE